MATDADRLLEELARAQAVVAHLTACLTLASQVRDHLMVRTVAAGKSVAQIRARTGLARSRVYAILERNQADD
jgi:DNA-binding phage protein